MKAVLKLEAIGDDICEQTRAYKNICKSFGCDSRFEEGDHRCPWVAKIIGLYASGKFQREFIRPKKDYSESNSKGSRGIFFWYTLESGNYYDINELTSWKNSERYYCSVNNDGDITRVDENEIWVHFEREIMARARERNVAKATKNARN